jgi:hypothetical protein
MERMRDWKRKKERKEKLSHPPLTTSMNTVSNDTAPLNGLEQKRKQA